MAHGFLTPQDVSGESPLFGKIAKWLEDQWNKERETTKKNKEEVSGKLDTLQKTVDAVVRDVTRRQAPAYNMLRGSQPKALPSGTKALPPGGPRLPGSSRGPKGSAITNLSGGGGSGISADAFFKRAQSGVGASGEYLTNAQRKQAFIRSRQEAVKTATATNSPAISPDSGADIVAAVVKNTEAISTLVKVTKEQTSNDTKLSERSALTQEKLMGRQRAAAEERNLEQGKDMSGFLTPTMKKLEKQAKGGGMGGYDANMNRRSTASDLLDIGSDIMDMRKGKVRRITQGRDGRTSRQRLRDMRARRAGGGIKPRGRLGALSRLGGAASKGGALGGLGGGLKGAARGLGKSGPLALLTAGLEFGDRMSSGQNAFQAGAGTAGSVGGGLAGAAAGAAIGSIVPGVGTVIGGLIGGMLGSMAGGGTADMLTGANKIPSGAGGMLSSGPMSGYMSMLHGTELTLSGNNKKETKNIGEALGEGMIMASLGPLNSKVLELSAKGMKHYYENMGGKSMFEGLGDIFKTGMQGMANLVHGLGGVLANLTLGGAAHAGTMPGGTMPGGNVSGITSNSAEEARIAAALVTEGGGGTAATDILQVAANRIASGQYSNYTDVFAAPNQFQGVYENPRGGIQGYRNIQSIADAAAWAGVSEDVIKARIADIRNPQLRADSANFVKGAMQFRAAPAYYLSHGLESGMSADGRFHNSSWRGGAGDNQFFTTPGDMGAVSAAAPINYDGMNASGQGPGAGKTVVLAGGTNNYEDPQGVKRDLSSAIKSLKSKGYNVVVVAPNRITYPQANQAAKAAAIAEGATVEDPLYGGARGNDPLHLTPASVTAIKNKYPGAIFMGDSNAVRLNDYTEVPGVSKEGIPTGDIAQYAQNFMPSGNMPSGNMPPAAPPSMSSPSTPMLPGVMQTSASTPASTPASMPPSTSDNKPIFPFPGQSHVTHKKGWRASTNSYHAGQDIVETPGAQGYRADPRTPILAAHDGVVQQQHYNNSRDAYLAGLRIWHPALGKSIRYLHMNPDLRPGDRVTRGQVVGSLVPIGSADSNWHNTHLHLEFYDQDAKSVREDSNQIYEQFSSSATRVSYDQARSAARPGTGGSALLSGGGMLASGAPRPNPLGAAPPDLFGTGAVPVPASPAAANTGTGVMQASAQTSGPVFQQPVTVINNYNVAGQGGGGDVIPNTLGAGVSMGQMGLDSFSQLKIRALG